MELHVAIDCYFEILSHFNSLLNISLGLHWGLSLHMCEIFTLVSIWFVVQSYLNTICHPPGIEDFQPRIDMTRDDEQVSAGA